MDPPGVDQLPLYPFQAIQSLPDLLLSLNPEGDVLFDAGLGCGEAGNGLCPGGEAFLGANPSLYPDG